MTAYRCSRRPISIGVRLAIVTLNGSCTPKPAQALSVRAHTSTSNPFFIGVLQSGLTARWPSGLPPAFADLTLQEVTRNPTRRRFFVSIGIPDSKEVVSGGLWLDTGRPLRDALIGCRAFSMLRRALKCTGAPRAICNGLSPVLPAVTASNCASRIETQSLFPRTFRRCPRDTVLLYSTVMAQPHPSGLCLDESFRSHPWIQKHPGDRIAGQLFMRRIVSHRNCWHSVFQ